MPKFRARTRPVHRSGGRRGGRSQSAATPGGGPLVWAEVDKPRDLMKVDLRAVVDVLAPLIIGKILERTDRGKDTDGAAFKPYSASHAKTRRERGLSTNPVDLRMTGQLLGSIGLRKVVLRPDGFDIEIAPAPDQMLKAKHLEQYGRQFVGLSGADLRRIAAELERRGIPVDIARA